MVSQKRRENTTMIQSILHSIGMNEFYAQALINDIPAERFCEQPGAVRNHPAWNVGHITLGLDGAAVALGLESQVPEQWQALFGQGSMPTSKAADYPDKETLLKTFNDQLARVKQAIPEQLPAKAADQNPFERIRDFLPTVGDFVVFVTTVHPAVHLGQISSWRREAKLGRVLPMDQQLPI
jgi:hypothetical protein